jgi:hypothetical protein
MSAVTDAMTDLLATCADAVMRTSEGRDILCTRYTCMASCAVLRDLMDGVTLDKTPDGKTIIPVPAVAYTTLELAVHLIHGVRLVSSLTIGEVARACEGMDVLGCTALEESLMDRLWDLVGNQASLKLLREHADRLLRSTPHRRAVVRHALRMAPLWRDFRTGFLDGLAMGGPLAIFLADALTSFFPPPVVIRTLVKALPPESRTQDTILKLAGLQHAGACYHPAETETLLEVLTTAFTEGGWDPTLRAVFENLLEAHRAYVVAPACTSVLSGSAIHYEKACTASVYLRPMHMTASRCRRITPWLRVLLNPETGAIQMWVTPGHLRGMPTGRTRNFQLRVTASTAKNERDVDVWYVWDEVVYPHSATLSLHNVTRCLGVVADLYGVVRGSHLRGLRFDLFYETFSALEEPTLV